MSRVLGVDCGTKRVGLALSDPLGILASPLEVVAAPKAVETVVALAKDVDIGTIVVGLPTGLRGHEGASVEAAKALGESLREATGLPVEYHDERFTSRLAESTLLEQGMKRRQRRERVDKIAATIILQDYLDNR